MVVMTLLFKLFNHEKIDPGGDLLSQSLARLVPSALVGLTTEFGMGSGVAPPEKPPGKSATKGF